MLVEPFKSLLYSRKFLLAVFGVVQAIVLHYADVPPEIWQSIAALVVVLIASIAYEDGAMKGNAGSQTNLMTAGDSDVTVNQPSSTVPAEPQPVHDPEVNYYVGEGE